MLLLSNSTGCYSNTLIDAETNVPIFFVWAGLRVTLLRNYLGIDQLFMRGSSKKKLGFGQKRGLVHCRHFSDNGKGVRCGCPNFLFQKSKILRCFCMEKSA